MGEEKVAQGAAVAVWGEAGGGTTYSWAKARCRRVLAISKKEHQVTPQRVTPSRDLVPTRLDPAAVCAMPWGVAL